MRFFHIFVYIVMCSAAWADLFSALVGMEDLVTTERALLDSLRAYLKSQDDHLVLRKQFDAYNAEHQLAMKDVTNYLANPINAFKIIKRLHLDWNITGNIVLNHNPEAYQQIMEFKNELVFPDDDDLSAASDAMLRLQNLYMLDSEEISNGKLKGIQYSLPMTASDCFELGYQLAKMKLFVNATTWLTIALNKYEDDDPNPNIKSVILEWLAHSSIKQGDLDKALRVTRDLLQWEPENEWAQSQFSVFTEISQKRDTMGEVPKVPNQDTPRNPYFVKNYAELCRDELDLPEDTKKHLKCYYLTKNDPFLRLAPVKVEEHYLDPYVVVFYDVIYDNEIKFLQDTAGSRLERSLVEDPKTSLGILDTVRLSKQCWLDDTEGEVVNTLSRRVGHLTGLSTESAEAFQVVNYGTGGHYEPHMDFTKKKSKKSILGNRDGNRLATFIYYLSDVAQGGRTVFPELGVGVTPRKGSALFWYNLHPSGEGNYATLHGGCPVLQGTKWIANKWILQRGQELRLPCDLEYQDEGMTKTYPAPVPRYNHSQYHTF